MTFSIPHSPVKGSAVAMGPDQARGEALSPEKTVPPRWDPNPRALTSLSPPCSRRRLRAGAAPGQDGHKVSFASDSVKFRGFGFSFFLFFFKVPNTSYGF